MIANSISRLFAAAIALGVGSAAVCAAEYTYPAAAPVRLPAVFDEQNLTPTAAMPVAAVPLPPAEAVGQKGAWGETAPACKTAGEGSCNRLWVSAEYLAWWTRAMSTPPLVSTAARGNPAILGQGGEVLYGGDDVLDNIRQGGRLRAGFWLDPCHISAIEGEYFALANSSDSFMDGGDPNRTTARPFINAQTGQPTTELVNYLPPVGVPFAGSGALCGMVTVDASSDFSGAGLRYRRCWCGDEDACGNGWCVDWLAGYRYLSLNEGLAIRERLTSLDPNRPYAAFDILDDFGADNQFNGADLGFVLTGHRQRWTLDLLGKLGLGATRSRVAIDGRTTLTNTLTGQSVTSTVSVPPGPNVYTGGGLLAQRSNIGIYTEDSISLVPEIGLTLGYQLAPHIKTTLGYSLIVWTNVMRPGDQIDPYVNPDLLPDEITPVTGPLAPNFPGATSTFWAQGLSGGLQVDF